MPSTSRRLAAYVLLALGALWLLVSLGLLSAAPLSAALRLWPVLLIGLGVDILVQRRLLKLPYTALVFVGLLVYGLVAPTTGALSEEVFREPVDGAGRLELDLDLSSATTSLQALTSTDDLVRATIRDVGSVRFSAKGDRTKRVSLEKLSRRNVRWDGNVKRHWDIAVNGAIPLSLSAEGGSGAATLDLSALSLRELDLELASGATTLSLPATDEPYEAEIEGGSGRVSVAIAPGAQLELDAELGSGGAAFAFGGTGNAAGYAELRVEGGSGGVTFDVPETGNVRFEVKDDASGALILPDWLEQLEGDAEEGIWQTRGFNADWGQILITIEDRGSGAITVR